MQINNTSRREQQRIRRAAVIDEDDDDEEATDSRGSGPHVVEAAVDVEVELEEIDFFETAEGEDTEAHMLFVMPGARVADAREVHSSGASQSIRER